MQCFCGSTVDYSLCCQPMHLGLQQAGNPQQLMRSRYSAYVVGAYDYVLATYHPVKTSVDPAQTLHEIREFGEQSCFLRLKVLQEAAAGSALANLSGWSSLPPLPGSVPQDATGYVHFQAVLLDGERVGLLDEISRFVYDEQRWFYLDGILQPYKTSKVGRNDDCPCGSGKKFKHCAAQHWVKS